MISNYNKSWYVAQLKPNGFDKARINLVRQGFEYFMPVRQVTIRHARNLKNVLRPVFPGYIFIKFGLDNENWRKINSTRGVNKLISFNVDGPAKIPEPLMEGFMARCDEKQILKPISNWKKGEKARIVNGPFSDFIGQVEELVSEDRVRLLFNLIEQYRVIEMPSANLERIF